MIVPPLTKRYDDPLAPDPLKPNPLGIARCLSIFPMNRNSSFGLRTIPYPVRSSQASRRKTSYFGKLNRILVHPIRVIHTLRQMLGRELLQGFIKRLPFRLFPRGLPSQVKGAGLRTLSRRGSWVQIPPPAPFCELAQR